MAYTLFIDESGQSGIRKIATETSAGASQYFILGAALIDNREYCSIKQSLEDVRTTIGNKKHLHCSTLNHNQKVFFAQKVAEMNIVCFGLISRKQTLGEYKQEIEGDSTKFFNKCAVYLLECVGDFLSQHDISQNDIKVVFEEGDHDYAKFRSYIHKCQSNPFHQRARLLRRFSLQKIVDASKEKEPLLQIADLIAHALYQTVTKEKSSLGVTEIRYLQEIHTRFYCNPQTKKICPAGLKPIHSIDQIELEPQYKEMFSNFKGNLRLPIS